jgi:hypothetical protein
LRVDTGLSLRSSGSAANLFGVIDPVLERFRESLARSRTSGAPFIDAWDVAMRTLPQTTGKEPGWRPAVAQTMAAWCDAYEGRPASSKVQACATVAFDPDRLTIDGCRGCSGPLPEGHPPRQTHCSDRCRKRAADQSLAVLPSAGRRSHLVAA